MDSRENVGTAVKGEPAVNPDIDPPPVSLELPGVVAALGVESENLKLMGFFG